MYDSSFQTGNLREWLLRLQSGDAAARDELLRACQNRLLTLVRKMLRRNPSVHRWADSGDVFNNSALRLLRALENTSVANTKEFFNLAAAVIRRELIDLARHFHGPHGIGANQETPRGGSFPDPPARDDPEDLDRWTALHEAIGALPPDERSVFELTFYHGWTQAQIAELFEVSDRDIRRKWRRAVDALRGVLDGQLPEV